MIGHSYPRHRDISMAFLVEMCAVLSYSKFHRIGAQAGANQTVPYGTAPLGGAVPGTSCQARHEQAIARRMATIAPSLRDKSQAKEPFREFGKGPKLQTTHFSCLAIRRPVLPAK
jgi:hypothetical protein